MSLAQMLYLREAASEGEAIVDLSSSGGEDDFEALAENDKKLTEQEG